MKTHGFHSVLRELGALAPRAIAHTRSTLAELIGVFFEAHVPEKNVDFIVLIDVASLSVEKISFRPFSGVRTLASRSPLANAIGVKIHAHVADFYGILLYKTANGTFRLIPLGSVFLYCYTNFVITCVFDNVGTGVR